MLLAAGADPAATAYRSYKARTPLHIAAVSGSLEAAKALVEGGAPLGALDADGLAPEGAARRALEEALCPEEEEEEEEESLQEKVDKLRQVVEYLAGCSE